MINEKSEGVNIINIVPFLMQGHTTPSIYGLGDNNMVYFWDASKHVWILWG